MEWRYGRMKMLLRVFCFYLLTNEYNNIKNSQNMY